MSDMVSKLKGWQWITLENVLQTLETGKRPKGGVLHQDSGVLSISAEHMTPSGGIDTSIGRFVPVDFYQAMKKGKVQPGDVLVVKDGATTGKTAYADNSLQGEPLAVNEHVFICRPNRDVINPRFLFYWLWSEEGWAQIRTCYQGSTIGGINRSFIQKVTVPLPPLCEQKRIAALLNQQMAYVEKARKAAEEMLEAAQALPGAFLRQTFPAHGDALPAGWKWTQLGDVCNKIKTTDPKRNPDNQFIYVDISSIDRSVKRITTPSVRMGKDAPSRARRIIHKGDVLVATTRPNLNAVALVGDDLDGQICSTGLCVLRPDGRWLDSNYLYRYTTHEPFVTALTEMVNGSMYPAVTDKHVMGQQIPLPPLPEQKHIAALLNEQMAYVETVRMSAREQLDAINALPNALLRRAFAGNC